MKVDIIGTGNTFKVYNSDTHEPIDVKHLTLNMTLDGNVEAILYVGVGRLSLAEMSRATDGVRDEGKAYESHNVGENPPNTKPVPVPKGG